MTKAAVPETKNPQYKQDNRVIEQEVRSRVAVPAPFVHVGKLHLVDDEIADQQYEHERQGSPLLIGRRAGEQLELGEQCCNCRHRQNELRRGPSHRPGRIVGGVGQRNQPEQLVRHWKEHGCACQCAPDTRCKCQEARNSGTARPCSSERSP